MPAPAAPANFRILNKGIDEGPSGLAKVRLAWDEVAGASYRAQRISAGAVLAQQLVIPGWFDALFTGLPVETACAFRLRAENADGVSAWVELAAVTGGRVLAAALTAPTGLTLVAQHNQLVTLSWTDTTHAEDHYRVTVGGAGVALVPTARGRVTFYYGLGTGPIEFRLQPMGGTDIGAGVASEVIEVNITLSDLTLLFTEVNLPSDAQWPTLPTRAWRGFPLGRAFVTVPGGGTVEAAGLPAGLTFEPVDADLAPATDPSEFWLLSGSTTAPAGLYAVTVSGEDGAAHTDEIPVEIALIEPEGVFDAETGLITRTVTAGESFSVALRFDPPAMEGELQAYTLTALVLPPGASLSRNGASSVDHVLSGTLPAGTYAIALTAEHGGGSVDCTFTLRVVSPITGPDLDGDLSGWIGDEMLSLVGYTGDCEVKNWFLRTELPGVEMTAVAACSDSPYDAEDKRYAAIAGAPTLPGIFEGQLSALVCCGGISRLVHRPVRFVISGGLFLGWYHAPDATRRELQVMMRSREVLSFTFAGGIWWKRGDRARLHVIFRDGPLPHGLPKVTLNEDGTTTTQESEANYGREILSADGFTALWFTLRLKSGDSEERVLLETGGAVVTETIGEHAVFVLEFDVTGDNLTMAIESAARQGEPQASIQLDCLGELTWVRGGREESSASVPVTIVQDIRR